MKKIFYLFFSFLLVSLVSGCISHSLQYNMLKSTPINKSSLKYHIKEIVFAGSWDGGRDYKASEDGIDAIEVAKIKENLYREFSDLFSKEKKNTLPISLVVLRIFSEDKKISESSIFDVLTSSFMERSYSYKFLIKAICYREQTFVPIEILYTRSRFVVTWFELFFDGTPTHSNNYPRRVTDGDYYVMDADTKELYEGIVAAIRILPEKKLLQQHLSQVVPKTKLL